MRSPALKRAMDLVVCVVAAIVLSPLVLATALAVRVMLGRPVLFRQQRPGLGGRSFEILKFRTMRDLRDSRGELLPDEVRLGRFGRWLRASQETSGISIRPVSLDFSVSRMVYLYQAWRPMVEK